MAKLYCKTANDLILKYGLNPNYILDKDGNKVKRPKEIQKVYLRGKAQSSGNVSLFLYTSVNGKYEKVYTGNILNIEVKEGMTSKQCKEIEERNKETMRLANDMANLYNIDAKHEANGFEAPTKVKVNLCDYITKLSNDAVKRSGSKAGYYKALHALNRHIILFSGDKTTFKQLNRKYVNEFFDYLRTAKNYNHQRAEDEKKHKDVALSENTQNRIYRNLRYVCNNAVQDGIIKENPLNYLKNEDKPKAKSGTREFLNIDDIKKLINTPCKQIDLKRAFIFCCLTGLRFSDISSLTWNKIKKEGNYTCVRFTMQKTKKECVVYLSNEALKWLPEEQGKANELVFSLASNYNVNKALHKWAENAGLDKVVTFHVARHTSATLNLSLGNSIEVVSEMLGHSNIKTTQIYAKILADSQKRVADKQKGLFD